MATRIRESRPASFWPLALVFALFVLFMYGPMLVIFLLSFQGPEGGLTFPMRGVSLHWFHKLAEGLGVVDIGAALWRSLGLGVAVMLCTVVLSVLAGLAFRKRLAGGNTLFFIVVASLIMPSIIVSLGIGLEFRLVDTGIKAALEWLGMESTLEGYGTSLGLFTSALGAHLTWTLPFGLLIMFAVFNRFNPAYEEAAHDLGATPWQGFAHVVLPLIAPSVVGIGMFGFTLSWDEIARTSQAIGDVNTLPLELQGLTSTVTTPSIYALGTLTTVVSFIVMGITLALVWALGRRRKVVRGKNGTLMTTTLPKPRRARAVVTEPPVPPDTTGQLSDNDMYDRMVSAILDHRLPPGTKLVEDKLAAAFGVSRTRVRPVLVRLANEQVVTLTPNRGASIAQPTPQEALEVFEARRLLEPRLVELFIANATDADIAALRTCIDDEEAARASGDMRRAIRLSGDFHLHIAQAAGHQTLGRILRELVSRTSLILMTYSPSHAQTREEATACGCREHRALIDAIRLRDAREAPRLMLAHLARIETQLEFTPPASGVPDLAQLLGT